MSERSSRLLMLAGEARSVLVPSTDWTSFSDTRASPVCRLLARVRRDGANGDDNNAPSPLPSLSNYDASLSPPPYGYVVHSALSSFCSLISSPAVSESEGVSDVLLWASLHVSGCEGVVDMVLEGEQSASREAATYVSVSLRAARA